VLTVFYAAVQALARSLGRFTANRSHWRTAWSAQTQSVTRCSVRVDILRPVRSVHQE